MLVDTLYDRELILKSDAQTQEEVFKEIGAFLLKKDLVNEQFTDAIIEREKNYPTGLDLAPVAEQLPNVAIPHTETEYCKSKAVVFVKLNNQITFHNMINPDEALRVKYLFFIINNEKTNQTDVLSNIMAFITNKENMRTLERLDTAESIYNFLIGRDE